MEETLFGTKASGNTADYVLRTAQQCNLILSSVADRKANILIGASFIMLTLMIGHVEQHGWSPALLVLAGFTMVAAIFAVLAVVPSPSTVRSVNRTNPLFFGSIASQDEESFKHRLSDVLESKQRVFAAIAHDLWEHSVVLKNQKYRYLRISYLTFLFGWAATAVTVAWTSIW